MAAKQFHEDMLEDLALLLDNFDKLKPIVEFPDCVGVGIYGLGRRIATERNLDSSTARAILSALSRLKRYCEAIRKTPAETVEIITRNIAASTPPEWQADYADKWRQHATELAELVGKIGDDHPITIALKAQTLVYTHQNIFIGGRIITDVRPVFNDDATEIDELVVTHMLTIDYTDGTQRNTVLTLAMDQEDIAQLQQQCERAATKVLTLKQSLSQHFPLVVMPDTGENVP